MKPPAPRALLPLTIPGSWLYRAMVNARNRHYDEPDASVHLDRPTISIGNITTGGTGKSPMTAWVIQRLLDHDRKPGVLMRGYGGGNSRIRIDPEYDGPPAPRNFDSDEFLELRYRFGDGFPVAPDPDRIAGAKYLLHEHDIDVFVLDDGFQHRRVRRDLDVVLIDATQDTFNQRLLPAGHLREPPENLQRANAVVVTRSDKVDAQLAGQIELQHGRPPVAWSRHRWSRLDRFVGNCEPTPDTVESLKGRRVMTLLGVGNPESVERQAEAHGAAITRRFPVRDHQPYDAGLLRRIHDSAAEADVILTTTKDWVKLRTLIDWTEWRVPILVPRLEIELVDGEDALTELLLQASALQDSNEHFTH